MIPIPDDMQVAGVVTAAGFYRVDFNSLEELTDEWVRFSIRGNVHIMNIDHVVAFIEQDQR